jgi:hypothetical protein
VSFDRGGLIFVGVNSKRVLCGDREGPREEVQGSKQMPRREFPHAVNTAFVPLGEL